MRSGALHSRLGLSAAALLLAACRPVVPAEDPAKAPAAASSTQVDEPLPDQATPIAAARGAGVPVPKSNVLAGEARPTYEERDGGLIVEVLAPGHGAPAADGAELKLHYVMYVDGIERDNSYTRGKPFEFPLGKGRVIKGWDRGLVGVKKGDGIRLTVPPDLGYGDRKAGKISPNSTLIFEIEVLDIYYPTTAQARTAFQGPVLRTWVTNEGVEIQVLAGGTGDPCKKGDTVAVHYTITLDGGGKVDSSLDRGMAIRFAVGTGRVIKGFDAAVLGMRVGELRRVRYGPDLGYGNQARPKIPAGSTLVAELELMRVTPASP